MRRALPFAVVLAAAILLAMPVSRALDRLAAARAGRDRVAALAAGGAPSAVAPALAWRGNDAAAQIAAQASATAGRGGLLVEEMTAVGGDGLARVRLRVSGAPDAVIAFADTLERGRPLLRFARWRVEGAGATVRLTGELVAPWR